MVSTLSSLSRLIRSGLVLLKHDALIPIEVNDQLPPIWRFPANVLRALFAKKGPKLRVGMRYAAAFEQLGPAFIKLGQVLSTRADIFGDEFTDDLRHLKDQLPPFPKSVAEDAVAAALERPVDQLFIEFGEVIGAASIAQAHRAVLKDGRTVAVKILRPGIEDTIARDTAMMRLAAKMVHTLSPASRRMEPQAFVEAVAKSLLLELDLRLEASAADELGKIINEEPYMSAPAVVWSYVSKRVMVTEWARGMALSRPDALEQPGIERKAMADNLIRAFLSQALNHGVFHADLHEGNLFCEAPDKLIAIDFGIIGRLKPKERRYLAEMLWGSCNATISAWPKCILKRAMSPKLRMSIRLRRPYGRLVSQSWVLPPPMCRWAACCSNCLKSPRSLTCTCGPNWCCCKRPWSASKVWRGVCTRPIICGKRPNRSLRRGFHANFRHWPKGGACLSGWSSACAKTKRAKAR